MNILPKKRWHVRTKENIERVRRDEAKAAEEEKEKLRKIALAEQEARTEQLRKRAQKRQYEIEGGDAGVAAVEAGSSNGHMIQFIKEGHVNLFADLEEGKKQGGVGNKEYEEEKKAEKEKAEKAIGLLTYLGQSSLEAQTSKPWYTESREKRRKIDETSGSDKKKKYECDAKHKAAMDPMNDMMKYIEVRQKQEHLKEKHLVKANKDQRHRHKEKKREHPKQPSSTKTIEQLRAERLKREREERQKTERLLAKARGEKVPDDTPEPVLDERKRGYNSQFNPEFVRKPKPRRDKYY